MQSPLSNPTESVAEDIPQRPAAGLRHCRGEADRGIRLPSWSGIAILIVRVKKATAMKISGLAMLTDATMLVLRRTDNVAKLYKVDIVESHEHSGKQMG